MDTILMHQVINTQTGYVVAESSNKTRARRLADRFDLAHGAIIHTVKATLTVKRTR